MNKTAKTITEQDVQRRTKQTRQLQGKTYKTGKPRQLQGKTYKRRTKQPRQRQGKTYKTGKPRPSAEPDNKRRSYLQKQHRRNDHLFQSSRRHQFRRFWSKSQAHNHVQGLCGLSRIALAVPQPGMVAAEAQSQRKNLRNRWLSLFHALLSRTTRSVPNGQCHGNRRLSVSTFSLTAQEPRLKRKEKEEKRKRKKVKKRRKKE